MQCELFTTGDEVTLATKWTESMYFDLYGRDPIAAEKVKNFMREARRKAGAKRQANMNVVRLATLEADFEQIKYSKYRALDKCK
jgi:hypothetical protein